MNFCTKPTRWTTFGLSILLFGFTMTSLGNAQDGPSKATMLKTLSEFWERLEQKELDAASEYLVLPPNFEPEMLSVFAERRELSREGIQCLEQHATYGKATDLFGPDRAKHFADRAKVDVDQCYGFLVDIDGASAEVVGFWNGTGFKLVRVNNVGQLQMTQFEKSAPSLAELEAAVEANPEDLGARALYAQALFKEGVLPSAWEQLMEAYKLEPGHAGVARGTSEMVQAFAERDVFTVGMPQDSIQGILGEPRAKVELGETRERWVYAHVGIDFKEGKFHELIDLRDIPEASFKPTEIVAVTLDGSGWSCGHRRRNRGNVVALYYLPGESYGNWSQQVTIERILNGTSAGTVEQIKNAITNQMVKMNAETRTKTLFQDEDSVIIASMVPHENPELTEHKLDHVMLGPVDIHRFAITVRGEEPDQEFQKKWLEISKSATLKPVEIPGK